MAQTKINVDGIDIKVDLQRLSDYSLTEKMIQVSAPLPQEGTSEFEETSIQRAVMTSELVDTVLGKDKEKTLKELRKKNGGFATLADVLNFTINVIQKATQMSEALKK